MYCSPLRPPSKIPWNTTHCPEPVEVWYHGSIANGLIKIVEFSGLSATVPGLLPKHCSLVNDHEYVSVSTTCQDKYFELDNSTRLISTA
jgi:hypothetical protein